MTSTREPQEPRHLAYRPTRKQVDDLIQRAATHPLGTAYLLDGALDSVAATFHVHGFTVEDARQQLRTPAKAARTNR